MSSPPFFTGMILGGTLISAMGLGSTVFVDKKPISLKSFSRDFIVGAVMVALIIQLLPESSTHLIELIMKFVPVSLGSAALYQAGGGGGEDMEVQVGIPKW